MIVPAITESLEARITALRRTIAESTNAVDTLIGLHAVLDERNGLRRENDTLRVKIVQALRNLEACHDHVIALEDEVKKLKQELAKINPGE